MQQQPAPPRSAGLRPLSFGELLDQVFRLYRRRFGLFFLLSLILTLPAIITQAIAGGPQIGYFLSLIQDPQVFSPTASGVPPAPPSPNFVALGLTYAVTLAIVPFTISTLVVATLRMIEGQPLSVSGILATVGRRYLPLFGLALLLGAISLSVLCLPLGIWLIVRFAVSVPVMMAERVGPIRALGRSWALSDGAWWRTFGLFAIVYLIIYAMNTVLGGFSFVFLLIPFIPAVVRGMLYATLTGLSSALLVPLLSIVSVLLYVDYRVRREAYDLEQLARDVSAGTGG